MVKPGEEKWRLSFPLVGVGSRGRLLNILFTGECHEEPVSGNDQMPRNHVHCISGAKWTEQQLMSVVRNKVECVLKEFGALGVSKWFWVELGRDINTIDLVLMFDLTFEQDDFLSPSKNLTFQAVLPSLITATVGLIVFRCQAVICCTMSLAFIVQWLLHDTYISCVSFSSFFYLFYFFIFFSQFVLFCFFLFQCMMLCYCYGSVSDHWPLCF